MDVIFCMMFSAKVAAHSLLVKISEFITFGRPTQFLAHHLGRANSKYQITYVRGNWMKIGICWPTQHQSNCAMCVGGGAGGDLKKKYRNKCCLEFASIVPIIGFGPSIRTQCKYNNTKSHWQTLSIPLHYERKY